MTRQPLESSIFVSGRPHNSANSAQNPEYGRDFNDPEFSGRSVAIEADQLETWTTEHLPGCEYRRQSRGT